MWLVEILRRVKAGIGFKIAPVAVILLGLAMTTWVRSNIWQSETSLIAHSVEQHADSPRWAAQRAGLARTHGEPYEALISHWQVAARLAQDEVMPRLELYRLLARLHYHADLEVMPEEYPDTTVTPGGHFPWPEDPPKVRSIYDFSPDVHDPVALKALMGEIRQDVNLVLARAIVSPTTIAALKNITDCYLFDTYYCRTIADPVRQWLEIAVRTERARKTELGHIFHALARLHAKHGEFGRAMRVVKDMQERTPNSTVHSLIEAAIAIDGKMFDLAGAALARAEQGDGPFSPSGRKIDYLKRKLEEARGQSRAGSIGAQLNRNSLSFYGAGTRLGAFPVPRRVTLKGLSARVNAG